jgi:hypothetical protein
MSTSRAQADGREPDDWMLARCSRKGGEDVLISCTMAKEYCSILRRMLGSKLWRVNTVIG